MDLDALTFLSSSGLLSPLDVHFGRFIAGKHIPGGICAYAGMAGALAGRYTGMGNVCVDLKRLSGRLWPPDAAPSEGVRLPDFSVWRRRLLEGEAVGRPGERKPLILDSKGRLYLFRYWNYERRLAEAILGLAAEPVRVPDVDGLKEGLLRLFPSDGVEETDRQQVAAMCALTRRFCVITGGPGTGKTTTVAKILALFVERQPEIAAKIALAAPTGKAAARLKESLRWAVSGLDCRKEVVEAVPMEACTIHRLLGSRVGTPYFQHHKENPLSKQLVIVDEASMVDLPLMSKLIQALPEQGRLILLGDKDQLASVEAGALLGDICSDEATDCFSEGFERLCRSLTGRPLSGWVRREDQSGLCDGIVELTRNYRFSDAGGIAVVGELVKQGKGTKALQVLAEGKAPGVTWRPLPGPDVLGRALKELVSDVFEDYGERVRETCKLGVGEEGAIGLLQYLRRFRILSPVRQGPFGVVGLNRMVESILGEYGTTGSGPAPYPGKPIMVLRNDYHLKLFNGDVGVLLPNPSNPGELFAYFETPEGAIRSYPIASLPQWETVYAMTVHKSQGSEFDRVLLVLPDRRVEVLSRELIYTAVSRAKRSVEIWGTESVFQFAVARKVERGSGLADALGFESD